MEIQSPFTFTFTFITILFFFFFFFFFFIVFKLLINNRSKTYSTLPPGPWKLPILGNLLQLAAGPLPHRTLRDLAQKHGPLMHLQLGQISAIVISSPREAKEVLKRHDLSFADRPGLLASEIMLYNNTDIAFAPYGDYWRQMRKICTLELLTAKKVRSFAFIREDEVCRLLESIRSFSSSTTSPINLSKKITSLASSIVSRAAFGSSCKDQDTMIKVIEVAISLGGGFDVADLFPSVKFLRVVSGMKAKLEKVHREIDQILNNIINDHRKKLASTKTVEEVEDLLDILLRLKDSSNLEFPITSNNIKAVIFDMFTGGTDTSSVTIEWAISEMMRNPRVMEKAQAELREVLKGKKIVHECDIERLSYLKLVIKETLRLHPPLPLLLPRECRVEECEIDGYKIPKKTKVIVNSWAIGRDKGSWEDAESFKPERFESSSVDFTGNNMEYIPFGAGRRMCPGVSFGIANVELPLAQLLYHFNWQLPNGKKPQDLDMSEAFGSVVRRRNNLYLIATPYM